jgi:hypothetical protein
MILGQQYGGNINGMQQPGGYGSSQFQPQQQQQFMPSTGYGQQQPAYSPLSANQIGYSNSPASQFPQQQLSYPINQLQSNGFGGQQFPIQQQSLSPSTAYNPTSILPNSIQDVLSTGNGMYSPMSRGLNSGQQMAANVQQMPNNVNAVQFPTAMTQQTPAGGFNSFNGQQAPQQQQQFFPQNQQFPQQQNPQLMNQGNFQQTPMVQQHAAFPMTHQDQPAVMSQQQSPTAFANASGNVPAAAKATPGMT